MVNFDFTNLCILIPAYQPDKCLIELVDQLLTCNYRQIVIINDGSDSSRQTIFYRWRSCPKVVVLEHKKNLGKGEALKTGFRWVLQNVAQDLQGVVTVDADGQHLPKDVRNISQTLLNMPAALILGSRVFDRRVPLRSRFGNILTRSIFRAKYKVDLRDTQTGLRGIPCAMLPTFLEISASRYEFETLCLIKAVKLQYEIIQVDMDTVYLDNNKSSHFNPFIDSIRIYYVFLRHSLIAIASFLIDLGVFVALNFLSQNIFSSLLVARILSSTFNFYQNKTAIYRSYDLSMMKQQAIKYCLWSVLMFVMSYFLIVGCVKLGMGVVMAKILVDAILFLLNFWLQKTLFFQGHAGKS